MRTEMSLNAQLEAALDFADKETPSSSSSSSSTAPSSSSSISAARRLMEVKKKQRESAEAINALFVPFGENNKSKSVGTGSEVLYDQISSSKVEDKYFWKSNGKHKNSKKGSKERKKAIGSNYHEKMSSKLAVKRGKAKQKNALKAMY